MTNPPDKPKVKPQPNVRGQISGADDSCLRGIIVLIGLLLMFGFILFVMSQF